jgi:hypothetical protein
MPHIGNILYFLTTLFYSLLYCSAHYVILPSSYHTTAKSDTSNDIANQSQQYVLSKFYKTFIINVYSVL